MTVGFEYGLTEAYGLTSSTQALTATGSFSIDISGLIPFRAYHFRAKATGASTVYGADMEFTTYGRVASRIVTSYEYDIFGNLIKVGEENVDEFHFNMITYDWLSRKIAMADPDMGAWSYGYDANGNLTTQTDAKGQTITLTYDELNRLTGKQYPEGSNTAEVTYGYDSGDYGSDAALLQLRGNSSQQRHPVHDAGIQRPAAGFDGAVLLQCPLL